MPTKRILRRALTATCWQAIAGAAATGIGRKLTMDSIDKLAAAGLDQVLPYHLVGDQDGVTDVGIWSRYPLAETRQLTGFAFAPVQAGIVVGGQQLTVIGFHSKAPVTSTGVGLWQSDLARLAEVMANPATPDHRGRRVQRHS
jgi:hypothetical protein